MCFTGRALVTAGKVGRCRLAVSKPELKARLVSALETINCDESLSNVAFKFKLRRYSKDGKIKLWSVFMQPMFQVDLAKVAEAGAVYAYRSLWRGVVHVGTIQPEIR